MRTTENEIYVNAPLPTEVADALKTRARKNGRCVGRELAQIAARILRGERNRRGKTVDGDQGAGRHANDKQSINK